MLMRLLARPGTEETGRVGDRAQREAEREREAEEQKLQTLFPRLTTPVASF
jgi:hypothetical protein